MSGMATTLTTIVKNKIALAALGTVLIGGGGTAVALAATTGHLGSIQTPGFAHSNDSGTQSDKSGDQGKSDSNNGDHPHTVSIEGVLASIKSCPTNSTRITVTKASESAEHDAKDTDKDDTNPGATHRPGTETLTITVNSKTRIVGNKADALADLCHAVGHRVQVQADKAANGALTAWKVTLQGADNAADGQGGNQSHSDGKAGSAAKPHASESIGGKVASARMRS